MNFRSISVIIIFCSVGWVSNSKLFLSNLNILLALIVFLALIRKRKFLQTKYLIIITIIMIYCIISCKNPFINEERRNLLVDVVSYNANEIKDKIKSKYYEKIANNIRNTKNIFPYESLAMTIEIDRSTSNSMLFSDKFINYYLHFISNPFLPTSVYLGNEYLSYIAYVITIILIVLLMLIEVNSRPKLKVFFWLQSFSLSILAFLGIYAKYNYLKGGIDLESEFIGLWNAPEKRISFSSFSYKNHWSGFVILTISMTLTLIYSNVKKKDILIIRCNTFYTLFLILCICVFSVFYSNSNSGLLLLSIYLLFFMYLILNITFLRWKVFFIFFTFCILIILYYNHGLFLRLSDLFQGNSFRFYLWNDLLYQIQCKTFWGYGFDSYKAINGIFQSNEISSARLQNLAGAHQLYIPLTQHGHSDFLQTISEIGFIGLCITAFPIIFLILRDLILYTDNQFPLISLGLFIVVIYSIIDFPFRNFAVLTLFLFLLFRFSFYGYKLSHISSCR